MGTPSPVVQPYFDSEEVVHASEHTKVQLSLPLLMYPAACLLPWRTCCTEYNVLRGCANLVPLLRPVPATAFLDGTCTHHASWAAALACMSNVYLSQTQKPASFSCEEDLYVVQFLLQELLPVLEVVSTLISQGSMPFAHTVPAAPTVPAQEPAGTQHVQQLPAAAPSRVADSLLLLLCAAANTVFLAIELNLGARACQLPSRYDNQLDPVTAAAPAGTASIFSGSSLLDPTNLERCLASVLCLANALVVDGPWWHQAKATQPLMLIQALECTSFVSACSSQPSALYNR
jgi:hypothetical protein